MLLQVVKAKGLEALRSSAVALVLFASTPSLIAHCHRISDGVDGRGARRAATSEPGPADCKIARRSPWRP